jgi:hypothetical protein
MPGSGSLSGPSSVRDGVRQPPPLRVARVPGGLRGRRPSGASRRDAWLSSERGAYGPSLAAVGPPAAAVVRNGLSPVSPCEYPVNNLLITYEFPMNFLTGSAAASAPLRVDFCTSLFKLSRFQSSSDREKRADNTAAAGQSSENHRNRTEQPLRGANACRVMVPVGLSSKSGTAPCALVRCMSGFQVVADGHHGTIMQPIPNPTGA